MLGTVYTSYRNPHASYYNCIWNNQTDIQRSWTIYRGLHGTPLQYSCLENPLDGGAWRATVHGVAKSRTRLSDFTFTFHFPALEKEMATHSSVLAWRIPGIREPGGLPSMGSQRVGHDWSDLAAAAASEDNGGRGSHARSAVLDPYLSQAFFLQTYHMQKF